jgi:hypothetical protein
MKIDVATARALFSRLPAALRLASLSPDYVESDASRSPALQPAYWRYEEAESFWYHGFHLTPLPGVEGFDIQSPYGYGGPLANSSDPHFLARAWQAYEETARAAGVAAEFIRFHPLADNTRFYGGRIEANRETVWVNLQADDLLAEYQPRVRSAIRKADLAGVEFAWFGSGFITPRFAEFYRCGMAAIGASPFYSFGDAYFEALAAWPAVRLGVCSLNGVWLAAGLFLHHGDCVEYHLAASSGAGRQYNASNLLLHRVASSAKAEGYGRLYLGGGTDGSRNNSLYFFKSGYSKCRATFSVGTFCHDGVRYEELKRRWPDLHRANAARLLFYR